MKRYCIAGVAVIVVCSLSACSLVRHKSEKQPSTEDFDNWSLVLNGERVDDLRADPEKIREAVRKLLKYEPWNDDKAGKKDDKSDDKKDDPERMDEKRYRALMAGKDPDDGVTPDALKGIAGFSTTGLKRASEGQRQLIRGKIRDYVYDDKTKSGHLAVDTWVTVFNDAKAFINDKPDEVIRYHWDIEIEAEAFEVQPHSGDPENPFPPTKKYPNPVQFTEETLRDIEARGLKYKLFAQGEKVVVRHVYRVGADGKLERLPAGHPFYEPSKESCIDIMFDRYPPALDLPPQRGYCLGRCDQPQVVNTGA